MGPVVQRFPQGEQKAHGARGGEVPGQKRGADGHAVQHLHGQLAPQKRLRGKPQAGHGADGIDDLAQRGGEKQLFPIVPQHLKNQLFLVLPVDLAAMGAEHMRLLPRLRIGKAGKGAVQRVPLPGKEDGHAADTLVHRHLVDAGQGQLESHALAVSSINFSSSAALASLMALASARMSEQPSCTVSTSRIT